MYYILGTVIPVLSLLIFVIVAVFVSEFGYYLFLMLEDISHEKDLWVREWFGGQEAAMNKSYLEQMETQNENYRAVMHDIKKHFQIMKNLKTVDEEYCNEVLKSLKCSGTKMCREI